MVTDATGSGGVTVTVAVPVDEPLLAVTSVLPSVTPVTTSIPVPRASLRTVATAGLLLDQDQSGGLLITRPAESRIVAVRMIVSPTATDAGVGVTTTDAGGRATIVTEAVSLSIPNVALTIAAPSPRAVTK